MKRERTKLKLRLRQEQRKAEGFYKEVTILRNSPRSYKRKRERERRLGMIASCQKETAVREEYCKGDCVKVE